MNNIPTLRFPKFTGEWEENKLEKMLSMVVDNRGKTPPVEKSGIPMLEVNTLGSKRLDYSKVSKYVNELTYKNWFRKHLQPNDILFSTVGNTALCSIYTGEERATVAQNVVGLRFANENPVFMYYLLSEKRNNHKFKRIEMGAVQPSVKVSQMINIWFSVPHIAEQQKIASFLSSVDEFVENLKKQKENFEKYKKGMMQKIFTQEIRFKDKNGKEFPKWNESELHDVVDFSTASYFEVDKNHKEGYYLVDMGAISSDGKLIVNKRTKNINGLLAIGDLVMPNRDIGHGDIIGKVASIDKDNKYVLGGNMYKLVVKNGNLSKFIFFLINSVKVNREMTRRSNGTSQLQLIRKDVETVKMLIPDFEEQQKIADFLTSIEKVIESRQEQIDLAENWKKGLMQRMFV